MDRGCIAESGTYADLMSSGGILAKLISEHGPSDAEQVAEEPGAAGTAASSPAAGADAGDDVLEGEGEEEEEEEEEAEKKEEGSSDAVVKGEKMIQDEKREEGRVKWAVFDAYARALPGGWNAAVGLLLLNVLKQAASVRAGLGIAWPYPLHPFLFRSPSPSGLPSGPVTTISNAS